MLPKNLKPTLTSISEDGKAVEPTELKKGSEQQQELQKRQELRKQKESQKRQEIQHRLALQDLQKQQEFQKRLELQKQQELQKRQALPTTKLTSPPIAPEKKSVDDAEYQKIHAKMFKKMMDGKYNYQVKQEILNDFLQLAKKGDVPSIKYLINEVNKLTKPTLKSSGEHIERLADQKLLGIDILSKLARFRVPEAMDTLFDKLKSLNISGEVNVSVNNAMKQAISTLVDLHHVPSIDYIIENENAQAKEYASLSKRPMDSRHKQALSAWTKLALDFNHQESLKQLHEQKQYPDLCYALSIIAGDEKALLSKNEPSDKNNFFLTCKQNGTFEKIRREKNIQDPFVILLEAIEQGLPKTKKYHEQLCSMVKDTGAKDPQIYLKMRRLKDKVENLPAGEKWLTDRELTSTELANMANDPRGFAKLAALPGFPVELAPLALQLSGDINERDKPNGRTALENAARMNNARLLRWILDPNNLKPTGKSLQRLPNNSIFDQFTRAIRETIVLGKSSQPLSKDVKDQFSCAVHEAILEGHMEALKVLMEKGNLIYDKNNPHPKQYIAEIMHAKYEGLDERKIALRMNPIFSRLKAYVDLSYEREQCELALTDAKASVKSKMHLLTDLEKQAGKKGSHPEDALNTYQFLMSKYISLMRQPPEDDKEHSHLKKCAEKINKYYGLALQLLSDYQDQKSFAQLFQRQFGREGQWLSTDEIQIVNRIFSNMQSPGMGEKVRAGLKDLMHGGKFFAPSNQSPSQSKAAPSSQQAAAAPDDKKYMTFKQPKK